MRQRPRDNPGMSYAKFPVSDLLGSPGSIDDVTVAVPLEMRFPHAEVEGAAVGQLRIEAARGGLIARGEVEVDVELECQRCLARFTEVLRVPILQLYGMADDDDSLPITGDGLIDLEAAIRDEVGLTIPLTPICRPDCAGLCDTCGTDLNTDPCEGHAAESTSPFAPLEGLFRPD